MQCTILSAKFALRAILLATCGMATVPISAAQRGALDPRVRWRVRLPGTAVTNYIAVAPTGTVYVNNNERLMALDANGSVQWDVPNTSQKPARPIDVAADGTIYLGGLGFGQVTALNPDGSLKWAYAPSSTARLLAGPNVGPDGNIYAIADGVGTFSLDPAGNLRWIGDFELSTATNNGEILFDSERFFAAINHFGGGPSLHVYNLQDGSEIWGSASIGIPWRGFPVLDPSGRVIGPRWPTWVQALNPGNGDADWFSHHPGQVNFLVNRPRVDGNGVVYTSDISGAELWAINPDGSTRWFQQQGTGFHSYINLSPNDEVIVANGSDTTAWMRGYDASDGALQWQVDLDPEQGLNPYMTGWDAVFTPDSRTVYVSTGFLGTGNDYGYLYAIAVDDEVGTSFCSGYEATVACPCGNASTVGGCLNSTGNGGDLIGRGSASVLVDDLTLEATGLTPNTPALFFSGTATTSAPLGDGWLCLGGSLRRFPVQATGASGSLSFTGAASHLGVATGDTRYFQLWHRDVGGPCGIGSNTTSALEVQFAP